MPIIKLAALSILGLAHAKALVDEAKAEKRDMTQIAVSGAIVTLCVAGVATVLAKSN
ncbi:hypothetical protein [Pseudomonas phage D6]|nr:hypothetical protein [Pseudomonas phage D6]